jgi:hypothetical protein
LVAQEQVLEHKIVPVTKETCQCGEEKVEEFEHQDRVTDLGGWRFVVLQVVLPALESVQLPLPVDELGVAWEGVDRHKILSSIGSGHRHLDRGQEPGDMPSTGELGVALRRGIRPAR